VYRFFQSASFMGRMANRGRSPKPTQLPLFGAKTIADLAKTVGGQRVRLSPTPMSLANSTYIAELITLFFDLRVFIPPG
jgi:hypothetical protein